MMTILAIGILLAVLYTGTVIWVNGELPDSISAMVYVMERHGQWVWTVWMWAVSVCVCIPLIDALPDAWKLLGFATLCCLVLCGAMPISSALTNKKWHDALGIAAGVLSQLCVAVVSPWWLAAWALWPFLMGSTVIQPDGGDMRKTFKGKGVFVAEAICLLTVAGAVTEYYLTIS